jgi:outer membrane protein OmpA-like peptidoglycan-associated protein
MKKANMKFFLFAFIFAFGCASSPAPQTKTDAGIDISSMNKQLTDQSISGFAYKSSKLDNAKWDKWAIKAAPIVKEILNKLPEGYVLQATGHTDSSGPEEATGDKPGNYKISTDRAKTVYDALKRANISSPKITYKGIGSDELLSEYAPKAAEQRRVSFKIVAK